MVKYKFLIFLVLLVGCKTVPTTTDNAPESSYDKWVNYYKSHPNYIFIDIKNPDNLTPLILSKSDLELKPKEVVIPGFNTISVSWLRKISQNDTILISRSDCMILDFMTHNISSLDTGSYYFDFMGCSTDEILLMSIK